MTQLQLYKKFEFEMKKLSANTESLDILVGVPKGIRTPVAGVKGHELYYTWHYRFFLYFIKYNINK